VRGSTAKASNDYSDTSTSARTKATCCCTTDSICV